jgi:hypothetical protein
MEKMQKLSGAQDFAQFAQFPHGLQTNVGGLRRDAAPCSRRRARQSGTTGVTPTWRQPCVTCWPKV